MLKGIDISHYQEAAVLKGEINFKAYDFIICKATEGKTLKDKYFNKYMSMLPTSKLAGAYHYAHAESNKAVDEAKFFLSQVQYYLGSCLMALDLEGKSLTNKELDQWALDWCNYIYEKTGIRPLIYCSQSTCKYLKKTAAAGFGLWVAQYDVIRPKTVKPFPFWALWQYDNSDNLDKDYFNGTDEAFKKYCRSVK